MSRIKIILFLLATVIITTNSFPKEIKNKEEEKLMKDIELFEKAFYNVENIKNENDLKKYLLNRKDILSTISNNKNLMNFLNKEIESESINKVTIALILVAYLKDINFKYFTDKIDNIIKNKIDKFEVDISIKPNEAKEYFRMLKAFILYKKNITKEYNLYIISKFLFTKNANYYFNSYVFLEKFVLRNIFIFLYQFFHNQMVDLLKI